METRRKYRRDQALSEGVIPPAEFPARMGESTPESGDLGDIGAAGIVGDSHPSSTRPPTEVVSPHMSVHEADIDGPPLLQRADQAPITTSINPRPLHIEHCDSYGPPESTTQTAIDWVSRFCTTHGTESSSTLAPDGKYD